MTNVYLFVLGLFLGFCGGYMIGAITAINDITNCYNDDEEEEN